METFTFAKYRYWWINVDINRWINVDITNEITCILCVLYVCVYVSYNNNVVYKMTSLRDAIKHKNVE